MLHECFVCVNVIEPLLNKRLVPLQDIWGYQKTKVRNKVRKSKTTGSEGFKLTTLDELVLDAIGRDSAYMAGIDSATLDPPPSVRNTTSLSLSGDMQENSAPEGTFVNPLPFARKSAPPAILNEDSQTEFEFRQPFQDMTGKYNYLLKNGNYCYPSQKLFD